MNTVKFKSDQTKNKRLAVLREEYQIRPDSDPFQVAANGPYSQCHSNSDAFSITKTDNMSHHHDAPAEIFQSGPSGN